MLIIGQDAKTGCNLNLKNNEDFNLQSVQAKIIKSFRSEDIAIGVKNKYKMLSLIRYSDDCYGFILKTENVYGKDSNLITGLTYNT